MQDSTQEISPEAQLLVGRATSIVACWLACQQDLEYAHSVLEESEPESKWWWPFLRSRRRLMNNRAIAREVQENAPGHLMMHEAELREVRTELRDRWGLDFSYTPTEVGFSAYLTEVGDEEVATYIGEFRCSYH